jgi:phosphoribosylformylglycinamidine (FGAM) synthase-like amidotransferase family enzyme
MGMMPHPERAIEPLLGSDDGMAVFASMAAFVNALSETTA